LERLGVDDGDDVCWLRHQSTRRPPPTGEA
jgi:hypothetical protein